MARIFAITALRTRTFLYSLLGLVLMAPAALAAEPENWQLGFQPAATPVKHQIESFHDMLLVIIFAIAVFVLALLIYVCVRFRASANPTASKTSHNTLIEIIWTAVPVLILVLIAIPSFRILYYQDRAVDPDMTIKVEARQWYWNYQYPDEEIGFDSYMISEEDAAAQGKKRLLDVDNPLVVPVGKKVQVLVTTGDVMHSFFVPSAGVQVYGTPGRVNETWFEFEEPGLYYGQCNQICGLNHAYMPIVVDARSEADYAAWLQEAKQKFAMTDDAPINVARAVTE
jgi:cytochrome c oxidase subunit 2